MTEGAAAVYIALATALAVWGTIALYLGRVGARLRQLQRELERMPPGSAPPGADSAAQPDPAPPPAPAEPAAAPALASAAASSADHPLRLIAWLALLEAAASPPVADGTLTIDARRAVSYLAAHERFVVQFDQFVITVGPGDLARLAALCRNAAAGFAAAPAAQPLANESIARN